MKKLIVQTKYKHKHTKIQIYKLQTYNYTRNDHSNIQVYKDNTNIVLTKYKHTDAYRHERIYASLFKKFLRELCLSLKLVCVL